MNLKQTENLQTFDLVNSNEQSLDGCITNRPTNGGQTKKPEGDEFQFKTCDFEVFLDATTLREIADHLDLLNRDPKYGVLESES